MGESNHQSLTTIFKEGLDIYNTVSNSDLPMNSLDIQINIKKAVKIFEDATRLVSLAGIFSRNEGIDEVATNDIQYFLLPALLGSLSLKLTTGERKDIVNVAEIYFKDFLNRCNDYGMSDYQINADQDKDKNDDTVRDKTDFEKLEVAVNMRAKKIQRFSEQKELKSRLTDLKKNMENEHVDEGIKRKYFLTMIKLFIHEAIDELNSIEMEKPILEHMAKIKLDDKPLPKRPPPAPLKPIIITKDEVQKAVFGAGYPSLPTMTVQEFYDKRVADGVFPDPNKKPTGTGSLLEAASSGVPLFDDDLEDAQKEKLEENDDEENIARMRAMDEYKDDHRRGWGNRMNRS